MPTIVDSLFLELGIDTSKFSADQQRAIGQIQKFESQAKRSAGKSVDAIKTVGQAFHDIAKDSRLGASAGALDNFAKKLRNLGQAAQVSGGVGTPFGVMANGLGMLLSPAALGIAAIGLLGKGMWDLNKEMTATNATMFRQSQLAGMNASNLWAWGEAAKTVGANPQDITGGITGLQTSIAGMMIGAGNATPQLIALARLGLHWNSKNGLDDTQVTQMFSRVHQLAASRGYKNLGGLRSLTGPLMNDAMWALATSPNFNPASIQKQIKAQEPPNLNEILRKSLSGQEVLGKLGIKEDIMKEIAFGGEQGLMMSVVEILSKLLDIANKTLEYIAELVNFFKHPGEIPKKVGQAAESAWEGFTDFMGALLGRPSADVQKKMAQAMKTLTASGIDKETASAIVGSMVQESSMDPLARGAGNHVGLKQWDASRQAAFAKRYGYAMGSEGIDPYRQFMDELQFAAYELKTRKGEKSSIADASGLWGKTAAFMHLDEVVNDGSFSRRLGFAMQALQFDQLGSLLAAATAKMGGSTNTVTHHTKIGDVHVHTPATDPQGHAAAVRQGIAGQPLLNLPAQNTVSLATRGMAN